MAPLHILLATRPELMPDATFTVLGDFNLHHPLWNEPDRDRPIEPEAEELVEVLIALSGTQLKSQTGIPTFHGAQGSSVIDLVFVSAAADELYEACVTSANSEDDHSSDHYPILHRISLQLPPLNESPRYNYKSTDWTRVLDHASKSLANWEKPRPLRASIDTATSKLTEYIQSALRTHAKVLQPSPFSKRWWSKRLTLLRKEAARLRHKAQRTHTEEDLETWRKARSSFQHQVRLEKRTHWRTFLATLNETNLFTAARYATKAATPRFIPPIQGPDGPQNLVSAPSDQADIFRNLFFTAPQAPDLSDIPAAPAFPPEHPHVALTINELDTEIRKMAPNKAPGPDDISVLVLVRLWPAIRKPLFELFQVCLRLGYYPSAWREAISLILRKPKRPDYSLPNAYRPIALLCTMGKLFETLIARRLSFLADRHNLLPNTHIGCRPGRSTEDGIIAITEQIKNEWRKGNVVGALLIDVKNAFPSVSKQRLLHNLRKRRIPKVLVSLIASFLSNRSSSIKCSDYTSPQHPCDVGIPQGSPLSGILYLFYNADILDVTSISITLNSQGWADDIIHLSSAPTVAEIRPDLHLAGAHSLIWGVHSASALDIQKTQYTYFTRNPNKRDDTPVRFGMTYIPASKTVTYLGAQLDSQLRFREHGNAAVKKAHGALMALTSLARTTYGIPMRQFQSLVAMCVHPRSDYAAIAWHPYNSSTQTASRLDKVQRLAQRIALGAFRTTPAPALAYDSNTEMAGTRLDRKVTLSAIRLLTLPDTNPAAKLTKRAFARDVKRHRSTLHRVFHSPNSFEFPRNIETITPQPKPPWWKSKFTGHIAADKETAIGNHADIPHAAHTYHLYSDGSKTELGVGAGAFNPQHRARLRQRLGNSRFHTVMEGELVGIRLALKLAKLLPPTAIAIHIYLDNQAAIRACTNHPHQRPGQHIILDIHKDADALAVSHPSAKLHLTWVPGHKDIPGNDAADKEAKAAADDVDGNDEPIPQSAAAARQDARAHIKPPPENQRVGAHHRRIRGKLSSKKTAALLATLPRAQCSLLVQLRSGHIPLREYLARFGHADTPRCTHCNVTESVRHYLLICGRYTRARTRLLNSVRSLEDATLRNRGFDLATLLSHPDVIPLTLIFVAETGRFPRHTDNPALAFREN